MGKPGKLDMVVYTWIPSIWETAAERSPGQTSLG